MTLEYADGYVQNPTQPNCGIVAISSALRVNYDDVWNWFKARRNHRSNWKGRTCVRDYTPCIKHFGFKVERMSVEGRITLKRFCEWHTKGGTTYLVRIRGHVMVFRDGMLLDQSGIKTVADHRSKRCFVTDFWEIENV